MENNRSSKVIALVALIVAVVGLGIGFAAFSSTLTIESSATVTPDKAGWNVAFDTTYGTNGYTCTPTGATITTNPTVGATSVSGLKVDFTAPGQSVTCKFQVKNAGAYVAYLTKVAFADTGLNCAAQTTDLPEGYTQADAALVTNACAGIKATVTAGTNATATTLGDASKTANNWTTSSSDHNLAMTNGTEEVTLTIEYLADSVRADGPFTVEIPMASLTYSTVDAAN